MSNHSCIEHRANYHFLKFEEDYLALCQALKKNNKQSAYCKALLLAVLESWTNKKLSEEETSPVVYMTYTQWEESIYHLFGRTNIVACISELLKERLIARRPHTLPDGKATFAYVLNRSLVQKRLRELPERPDRPSRPKTNASKTECVQNETRSKTNGTGVQKRTATRSEVNDDPFRSERFLDSSDTDSCIDSDRDSDSGDDTKNGDGSENEEAPDGAVGLSSSFLKNDEEETPPPPQPSDISDQEWQQWEAWLDHLCSSPLSPELVLELASYYLPSLPPTSHNDQRENPEHKWREAAEVLASAPELRALPPHQARIRLAILLNFVTDARSPSWWVREFSQAGKQVRLWHIAKNAFKIGLDYDQCDYQPEDSLIEALVARCQCGECWPCRIRTMKETQERGRSVDADPEPNVTPEPDMDTASKIIEAVLPRDDGCGGHVGDADPDPETDAPNDGATVTTMSLLDSAMSFEACMTLLDQIREERPGYFVSHGKLRNGAGYIIHVHHSPGESMATITSPGEWYALLDELARRPKLTFAERVERARAKRRMQQEAS